MSWGGRGGSGSYGRPVPRLTVLILLCSIVLPPAAAAASWQAPVDGEPVRPFAVGPDRFAAGQHRGVDLAAPLGAPVRAACAGRVRFAGTVGDSGRTVSVTCGGLIASYLHLQTVTVRRGTRVATGDRVGTVGRSGAPRGAPHVHLGARRTADGVYVDPLTLLGDDRRSWPPVGARRHPPLGRAPQPQRPVGRGVRDAHAPAPVVAPASPGRPVPWAAVAGLALVVLAAVPVAAAPRRRRAARNTPVTGAMAARR